MLDDEAIALIAERGTFVVPNPYTNLYIIERGAEGGFQPYQIEKSREVYELKLESLRRAVRSGLFVPTARTAACSPRGQRAQMKIFVEAGMTPLEAIRSATLVNARLLRLEGKVGVLEPGAWRPDRGSRQPLEDVTALERRCS